MASTRIRINKRDIENGQPGKANSCPIALAIKRKVKAAESIVVGISEIRVNYNVVPVSNPNKVFMWVRNFDMHKPVKPFSFTLYL